MEKELNRSMARLSLPGYEKPYFISYLIKEIETFSLETALGAVVREERDRYRTLYGEVRVGDYHLDSSLLPSEQTYDDEESELLYTQYSRRAPVENDETAIRAELWRMTDALYKKAVSDYLRKKAKHAKKVREKDRPPDFSREEPARHEDVPLELTYDPDRWRDRLRRVSAEFRNYRELLDSEVKLNGARVVRYHANTEGNRVVTESRGYLLTMEVRARAEDGMLLEDRRWFWARRESELPSLTQLLEAAKELAEEMGALRKAPAIDPYTGPAILSGRAAAVFFHEVVGHRLEGERQKEEREGQTFKGRVGEKILPEFLTIYDDPTMEEINGIPLAGHYRYDDEGVKAQRALLVENGILRGFLLSRTPIQGFSRSNGHGRNSTAETPMARMANTIVESSSAVPRALLEEKLLEEVRRQGKEYGLYFEYVEGGETRTQRWDIQSFRGQPITVYRIWPDGRRELVRGAEFVGTPLASLNKILLTSDTPEVFDGYCGADSGYIPVASVSPAILLSEVEIQRRMSPKQRDPILPPPY